jgi:hypothetical protein
MTDPFQNVARVQNAARRAGLRTAALLLLTPSAIMATAALAQALPAAEVTPISTGFALPRAAGSLQYAVSAAESLSWGYYGNSGVASGTLLTGDLAYLSGAKKDTFSLVFSGGHSWTTSVEPAYTFINLALSQVIDAGRWSFVVADSVNYLPETPATGLSGIPGAGDLGVAPVQIGVDTGQGVLTDYSTRVDNSSTAGLSRDITAKTSINGSATYTILRFVDDPMGIGLDSDQKAGSAGLTHRTSLRNTWGANYSYSKFTYSGGFPGFTSQTATGLYTHQFTRKIGVSASAGPQWTEVASSSSAQSLTAFVDVSATYTGEFSSAAVFYTRGSNSGYGVTVGSLSDSVVATARKTFNRVWFGAATMAYTQTASLPGANITPYSFHTKVGGVQVTRAIYRSLSAYASYTVEDQSHQNAQSIGNVFDGFAQVVAFGITYSPTTIHLGHP